VVCNTKRFGLSSTDLECIRRHEHSFYEDAIEAAHNATSQENVDDRNTRHVSEPGEITVYSSQVTNDNDSPLAKSRKRKLEEIAVGGRELDFETEIAHLVPYNYACANQYLTLVSHMAGFEPADGIEDSVVEAQLKVLVHGSVTVGENGKKERVHNTGVKHNRVNMASFLAQKVYLDTWPSVLALPIMDLNEVCDYQGGEYEVILLASTPNAYTTCGIINPLPLASYAEIEKAIDTLTVFIKASAHVVTQDDMDDIVQELHSREKKKVSNGIASVKANGLRVPSLHVTEEQVRTGLVKVGKMKFSMTDDNAHQESDAFTLFLKAVAVESSMQEQKILGGCKAIHDCDKCLDEGFLSCRCNAYDPVKPIPTEIVIHPNENEDSNM